MEICGRSAAAVPEIFCFNQRNYNNGYSGLWLSMDDLAYFGKSAPNRIYDLQNPKKTMTTPKRTK